MDTSSAILIYCWKFRVERSKCFIWKSESFYKNFYNFYWNKHAQIFQMSLYNEFSKKFRPKSVTPFRLKYEKQTFLQFLRLFFLQENGLRCSMEIWQTGEIFVRKLRKFLFKLQKKWLEFSKAKKFLFGKVQRTSTSKNEFFTNNKKFFRSNIENDTKKVFYHKHHCL